MLKGISWWTCGDAGLVVVFIYAVVRAALRLHFGSVVSEKEDGFPIKRPPPLG